MHDVLPSLSNSPALAALQRSVARAVTCEGEGVHNGKSVRMTISPAPEGHGIVFERTDCAGDKNRIPALWNLVRVTPLCTQIVNAHGIEVRTIEHVMAALYALGIDNAHITISGEEVPIMDGSSLYFMDILEQAGITAYTAPREFIRIMRPVEVRQGDAFARFTPAESPRFTVQVAYPQHNVPEQVSSFDFEEGSFRQDVANARTFGFKTDIEYLHANGLALGGNFSNAILINEQGRIMNPGGYRATNELARHKLLDAVGDIALAGHVILGHMKSNRSGHKLNNALLRALFADTAAFTRIEKTESPRFSGAALNGTVTA